MSGSSGVRILKKANPQLDGTAFEEVNPATEETVTQGVVSTLNSTTTLLGIDGVYTGAAENITVYSSIFVNVFSNVASATDGLSIQFSQDGTNWDEIHIYNVSANSALDAVHPAHSQFFRVVYTNGGTEQAVFRLQTICKKVATPLTSDRLGTNIDDQETASLVRAVLAGQKPNGDYTNVHTTAGGNLKVSLEEANGSLKDNPVPVTERSKTAFGEVLTGQLYPQFQGSFEYTVSNTDLNTNTVVDGGTVTQASAMAVVATSTTTASSALFQSKQHAKYRPGLGGLSRFTALFTSPVAGTEQYIGIMDEAGSSEAFKNGYGIGYNGTTFGFHRWQNDSLTTVAQANWDDPMDGNGASGMTLDHTKVNVFQIRFQYLGVGAIQLGIEDDSTGQFVVAHTILYANNNTEPSVHNPNFFHTMWVANKATVSNMIMKSASYAYFIEGMTSLIELHQPQNSSGIREKTTVTAEVAIFTIRNKSTYASKTNFIDVILLAASGSIEASSANNLGSIRLIKNATLGGTPSYADINTTDSVIEIDTAGTTVTGGKDLGSMLLAGKNDGKRIGLAEHQLILNPGDTFTVAGTSANAATIDSLLAWKELF